MSSAGVIHLDPASLGRLLDRTDARSLRVVCALLALAPAGELVGRERAWARRAGLTVRELDMAIAELAAPGGAAGQPLLTVRATRRDPVRTYTFTGPAGLVVVHPAGRATSAEVGPAVGPGLRARGPLPTSPLELRDAARGVLAANSSEATLRLVDTWLTRLAELDGRDSLPYSLQIAQYEMVRGLIGDYGEPIAVEAVSAGLRNVRDTKAPDRYLRATAAGLYTEASLSRVNRTSRAAAAVAPGPSSPSSDDDF